MFPLMTLLIVALFITTLVDIILRDSSMVKHLPKVVWVLIVVFLPLVGSVLWWVLGREYSGGAPVRRVRPHRVDTPADPPSRTADTRTTEQQIADLDREIEEWRLREEIARRRQAADDGNASPAS